MRVYEHPAQPLQLPPQDGPAPAGSGEIPPLLPKMLHRLNNCSSFLLPHFSQTASFLSETLSRLVNSFPQLRQRKS
jgi:hypothetical protein